MHCPTTRRRGQFEAFDQGDAEARSLKTRRTDEQVTVVLGKPTPDLGSRRYAGSAALAYRCVERWVCCAWETLNGLLCGGVAGLCGACSGAYLLAMSGSLRLVRRALHSACCVVQRSPWRGVFWCRRGVSAAGRGVSLTLTYFRGL